MDKLATTSILLASMLLMISNVQATTPSPSGAAVYIISPADGARVSSPIKVQFGLNGMGVAPAGIDKTNTGHHHLLIDVASQDTGKSIGKDAQHKHFGGGQTETVIELKPGKHSLQLLMGDKGHVPHNPPVISKKIMITVR